MQTGFEQEKSMLLTIKHCFDDLMNTVWLMTKSRNKSPLLIAAQKNLVYMILQIMDYADRNPFKLKSKNLNQGDYSDVFTDYEMELMALGTDNLNQSKSKSPVTEIDKTEDNIYLDDDAADSREVQKKKFRDAAKKNIKPLQSSLGRRMTAKFYPESTDMVETGFPLLTSICSNSQENMALLFTENSWYHLERIYRKHPLKTLHFLKEVFDNNKSLLYVDLSIFERIFDIYRSFSQKIFAKKVRQIQTDNGILIFAWNQL